MNYQRIYAKMKRISYNLKAGSRCHLLRDILNTRNILNHRLVSGSGPPTPPLRLYLGIMFGSRMGMINSILMYILYFLHLLPKERENQSPLVSFLSIPLTM